MTPSEQERLAAAIWIEHRNRVAKIRSSPIDGNQPLVIPQSVSMARDFLADTYAKLLSTPADVPPLPEGIAAPFTVATHRDCCDEYISCVVDANGHAVNSFEEKWVDAINHALNAVYGKGKP